MSLPSLLAAGVETTARGYLSAAYRKGVQRLGPSSLRKIADRIVSRLRNPTPADAEAVARVVSEQDQAVRAARRLNQGGRMSIQGTPITAGFLEEASSLPRFKIDIVAEIVDPAGVVFDQLFTIRTDRLLNLDDILELVQNDQVERNPNSPPPPPGVGGSGMTVNDVRIISVERRA